MTSISHIVSLNSSFIPKLYNNLKIGMELALNYSLWHHSSKISGIQDRKKSDVASGIFPMPLCLQKIPRQ
jgi:hypothetical protein